MNTPFLSGVFFIRKVQWAVNSAGIEEGNEEIMTILKTSRKTKRDQKLHDPNFEE